MRARKISSKIKERGGPKKSSSEEGVSDDQEATSIEENSNCTVSPKQQNSPTKRRSISDKHHGEFLFMNTFLNKQLNFIFCFRISWTKNIQFNWL